MAKRKEPVSVQRDTIEVKTASGVVRLKRPAIIRSSRVNGMVLTRDEVRAFARLKARGRRLGQKINTKS